MTEQSNNMPQPGSISHKEYFLRYDNLKNITSEIIYSAFRRYNCLAGCKVCYTDHLFAKNDPAFGRFVPDELSQEYTDNLLHVFEHFYGVTTIDDLYWIKRKYPHIYDWYIEHQEIFAFGNMTDNNFLRCQPLLLKDFPKTRIYEITFSDQWLMKVNYPIVDMLDALHSNSPITKIKLILSQRYFNHPLLEWCKKSGVGISIHYDVMKLDTFDLDTEYQTLNFCSEDGYIYTICGESDYLQYDSFFLTLVDAIDAKQEPYDTLWNPVAHLAKSLEAKKELYTRYKTDLKDTTNPITYKYLDYFDWVTKHVHVNHDFNFIPIVSMNKWNKYYYKLVDLGWNETQYGLIYGNEQPKPLFTISD